MYSGRPPLRNPRQRRGCCLPLFLGLAGLAGGLFAGLVLPAGVRGWAVAHLPTRLGGQVATSTPAPLPTPTPPPVPTPTPIPTPTPTPLPAQLVIPPRSREVARLYNGWQVRTTLDETPGRAASYERETAPDYALDLQAQIKVPVAARTAAELSHSAPTLAAALPKLPALLEKAEVSKFYFGIYELKTELLRQNLTRLDALMGRDVFYDTDTVLELQDPDSKRKALLIQSDMDVDSDGSDPDRLLEVDASDPTFQPLTSYKWPKRTAAVSPLLTVYQERLARLENDLRTPALAAARHTTQAAIDALKNDIHQVEHYSSLIAKNDPYIVLPGFMARQNGHPFQPKLGDYAVVLAGDTLYPAIFGDIGPSYQLGEASLRLAQAVDPRATPQRSPVNELKITYLVFPGTADQPPGPPDLGHIHQRCQELLNEIGGNQAALHEWVSVLPTPTPAPTLTPTPVASPISTPTAGPTVTTLTPTPRPHTHFDGQADAGCLRDASREALTVSPRARKARDGHPPCRIPYRAAGAPAPHPA